MLLRPSNTIFHVQSSTARSDAYFATSKKRLSEWHRSKQTKQPLTAHLTYLTYTGRLGSGPCTSPSRHALKGQLCPTMSSKHAGAGSVSHLYSFVIVYLLFLCESTNRQGTCIVLHSKYAVRYTLAVELKLSGNIWHLVIFGPFHRKYGRKPKSRKFL